MESDRPADDEEPARSGFPISPHWADGYAFGSSGFVHVSEAPDGALVIESGTPVRLAPGDAAAGWYIAGRGGGQMIALVRSTAGDPEFRSTDLRSLLIANPFFLDGQLVDHRGRTHRVIVDERGRLTLRRGDERLLVGIEDLLVHALDALKSRTVLIVDKG